jgi:UPF0755 protein
MDDRNRDWGRTGRGHAVDLDDRALSRGGRISPRSASEALQPERIPPPPPRSRAVRHPAVIFLNFVLTVLTVAVVGLIGVFFIAKMQFEREGPLQTARTIEVARGSNLRSVAEQLEHAGIISNRWVFEINVRITQQTASLKPGEYLIDAHASMRSILDAMVSGRGILYSVTIPEGLTSQQIVDRLNANEDLVGDITSVPPEGSLLPETYKFTKGDTRANIIARMQRDRDRVVTEIWNRRVDGLPISSPDEMVILASIVEKETGLSDERSRVAAVFYNRLNAKMRLQSDPTTVYGVYGGRGLPQGRSITRADLNAVNDYNTYTRDGLPRGPIANPGKASLEAVANPSRTADLYFAADGSGGHAFAVSYEDHQRNVQRLRALEARRRANSANVGSANAVPPEATGTAGGTGAAAELLNPGPAAPAAGAPPAPASSGSTAVSSPGGAAPGKANSERVPLQNPPKR